MERKIYGERETERERLRETDWERERETHDKKKKREGSKRLRFPRSRLVPILGMF